MNKRIKKKKAKQVAIREALHKAYLARLNRILSPMWNHYQIIDTPLLRMSKNMSNDDLNYQIPYESR